MATVFPAASGFDVSTAFPSDWSLADLQDHLGGIPISRIRLYPAPGTATVKDLSINDGQRGPLCELIDGVLVEKTVGAYESRLAILLAVRLERFVEDRERKGVVLGADGTVQILPGQVRAPDASFIDSEATSGQPFPREAAPPLVPSLAIEVLSPSNTKREMDRKLREYFESGVRLVWYIDPATRSAKSFTAVDRYTSIAEEGSLSGGEILPGFEISLAELFRKADTMP